MKKMKRWIVYWSVQDPMAQPPWPACAGHRDAMIAPINDVEHLVPEEHYLKIDEVSEGICAFAAFGNCCNDPVDEIPFPDVSLLDRDA